MTSLLSSEPVVWQPSADVLAREMAASGLFCAGPHDCVDVDHLPHPDCLPVLDDPAVAE